MIDYYPYLLRAVQGAASADEQARRAVYVRAWQIVTDELRARRPPVSVEELRGHRTAIQSAMERIEREYSQYDPGAGPVHQAPAVAMARDWPIGSDEARPPPRSRRGIWTAAVVCVLVIAIGVGGYAAWSAFQTMAPKPPTTTAA